MIAYQNIAPSAGPSDIIKNIQQSEARISIDTQYFCKLIESFDLSQWSEKKWNAVDIQNMFLENKIELRFSEPIYIYMLPCKFFSACLI